VAGGRDVYALPLPAVVTVKEGLNLPRYPSVPGKLRAQRKPVDARTPERPEPRLAMMRLVVHEGDRKQAEVLGEGAAAAPRVVEVLREIGVLA
jgi:electron transfer flavoprotein beta subunit